MKILQGEGKNLPEASVNIKAAQRNLANFAKQQELQNQEMYKLSKKIEKNCALIRRADAVHVATSVLADVVADVADKKLTADQADKKLQKELLKKTESREKECMKPLTRGTKKSSEKRDIRL